MPVCPARFRGAAVVEEGGVQALGRAQRGKEAGGLLRGGRLHQQHDAFILRAHLEFVPDLAHVLLYRVAEGLAGVDIAVDFQIDEERVARGDGQLAAAQPVIAVGKAHIRRMEIIAHTARPAFARRRAGQLIQPRKAAGPREPDVVGLGILIEGEKFAVDLALVAAVVRRNQANDVALDGHRVEELHDAHALVALDDIELIHVFIGLDGRIDALLDDRGIERFPLAGKFAVLLEQRHEVGGKGARAAARGRADDALERYAHQMQRPRRQRQSARHHFVQHRQEGIFAAIAPLVIFAAAQLVGLRVILIIHGVTSLTRSFISLHTLSVYQFFCKESSPACCAERLHWMVLAL